MNQRMLFGGSSSYSFSVVSLGVWVKGILALCRKIVSPVRWGRLPTSSEAFLSAAAEVPGAASSAMVVDLEACEVAGAWGLVGIGPSGATTCLPCPATGGSA